MDYYDIDYYDILNLNDDCSSDEIKKQYRILSKKYHPDKNNGDDTDFKKINEAYETLSNDESRKEYNIKRIFKNIDFTNEEYKLLFSYYDKFINSKEYRLMKLLYNSIPEHVKNTIWDKFKKSNLKQIVPKNKSINIELLHENITIHLGVLKENKIYYKFYLLLIETKYGIIPLGIREYETIYINNINCILTIKFFIRDKYNDNR